MKIGLHVTSFSWPDAPASIAPTLAGVAAAADEAGISDLSFMDHWFQMDVMAPATEPMLEGYTSLGYMAALTETVTPRPAGHRRHVPRIRDCSPRPSPPSTCSRAVVRNSASAPRGTSASTRVSA